MSEKSPAVNWPGLWKTLPAEEQVKALRAFAHDLRHGPEAVQKDFAPGFLQELARALHFRPQSLAAMSDERLGKVMRQAMPGVMDETAWRLLFASHYFANKSPLMCRFLDLCGIPHDERGGVSDEVVPPEDMEAVTRTLAEAFGVDEVRRYYQVLLLHHPEVWGFVGPAVPEPAAGDAGLEPEDDTHPETINKDDGEEVTRELGESFTQLDRVLIEQVIATAAGEARALSPEEAFDLVQTVHALDTGRARTYFHLGFLNALLGEGEEGLNGPEMNDRRREWYLAGLLAGVARQRDLARMDRFIEQCRGDFERAAKTPGGAGASLAKTVFPLLLESGRVQPALMLLKGQLGVAVDAMGPLTLHWASELLRLGEAPEAKALLNTLHQGLRQLAGEGSPLWRSDFGRAVRRKLGQAYQAGGELERAKQLFEDLLADEDGASPKLLVDMGLAEAGFSGLQEVRVEGRAERRQALMASLAMSRERFEQAVERFADDAYHGHYVLAVYHYLRFMDGEAGVREQSEVARRAIRHAEAALSGIIGSEESDAFDRLGITGQSRFMLAVLKMSLLEPSQAVSAMRAWQAIPVHAGHFPKDHLARFLEWSDLTDPDTAIQIAESIWDVRGDEALDLLQQQEWVGGSARLREAFEKAARDANKPRVERFALWAFLVSALLRSGLPEQAADGLDAMEAMAEEDSELAARFVDWLQDQAHYDPAWREADALRARFRCYSRQGDRGNALATLRNLFHAVKAENPVEAAQIRGLVIEYEGNVDGASDLILEDDGQALSSEDAEDVEQRLESGEKVRVLFVGGNEIQAQYDDRICNAIRRDWPGVEIVFEHTGWSSNWGREVDRLKKLAGESDAVVLMSMMRTILGRTLRAALNDPPRPWIPCTGTGKQAVETSVREAIRVGLARRG